MVKSLVIWVIRVPWQSKQIGAAVDVSAEIVSYSYFYWKKYDCNWVTKLRSRYYCNMFRIRPRMIRCHWSFDPWWVKISGHSEQLGPCGSASHFVNNRHSKVKTRGASCIGGFGRTDGRRKFKLGIPQSRGASYIRGVSYIRDKTVVSFQVIPSQQITYRIKFIDRKLQVIYTKSQPTPGCLWILSWRNMVARSTGPISTNKEGNQG